MTSDGDRVGGISRGWKWRTFLYSMEVLGKLKKGILKENDIALWWSSEGE